MREPAGMEQIGQEPLTNKEVRENPTARLLALAFAAVIIMMSGMGVVVYQQRQAAGLVKEVKADLVNDNRIRDQENRDRTERGVKAISEALAAIQTQHDVQSERQITLINELRELIANLQGNSNSLPGISENGPPGPSGPPGPQGAEGPPGPVVTIPIPTPPPEPATTTTTIPCGGLLQPPC